MIATDFLQDIPALEKYIAQRLPSMLRGNWPTRVWRWSISKKSRKRKQAEKWMRSHYFTGHAWRADNDSDFREFPK